MCTHRMGFQSSDLLLKPHNNDANTPLFSIQIINDVKKRFSCVLYKICDFNVRIYTFRS